MTTMLLGRPLTFGDEEQILEIKKQGIIGVVREEIDINDYRKEIRNLQSDIDDLESEKEDYYTQLEAEIKELYNTNKFLKQYSFGEVRDFIFKSI